MAKNYTTIQGDTWDIVSFKNYGSEKYVDLLIEKNYLHRQTVFFSAGAQLVIPDIETETQDSRNLPPWRRQ